MSRVLVWWGAGDASTVAADEAIKKYGHEKVEVLYCDTSKSEHPDNSRFKVDVEAFLKHPIKVLKSDEFDDIWQVFEKRRFLRDNRTGGAPCTGEMKIAVRHAYQQAGDLQIFGFTKDEEKRWIQFGKSFPDVQSEWILKDITKMECHEIIRKAGIELPMMYKLGYPNNNCTGCVKAQSVAYWTHIRQDFPEHFGKMSVLERKFNFALNRRTVKGERVPVFLDEIPPGVRKMKNGLNWECGVLCQTS